MIEFDATDSAACDRFHLNQIRDMQRRLLAHLGSGQTTDMAPSSMEHSAQFYTSEKQYRWEREHLFHEVPLLACLSADMPSPGDVYLFDGAGPAIVLTRDKNGEVNAFLNMCMHRGASVATECGPAARLTCRFHGWTYTLQGKLVGVPGREAFDDVELDQLSLVRVPVREWCGLIFVKAVPGDGPIDLESFLGEFASQLAMLKLGQSRAVHQSVLNTEANWKLMLDTHGEGYHFASLHPQTIAPNVVSNVSVYDRYGPHYRVSFAQKSHLDLMHQGRGDDDTTNYSCSMLLFPNTILFVSTFNIGKEPDSTEASQLDTSAFYYGVYRLFPGDNPGATVTHMSTYQPSEPSVAVDPGDWKATHEFIEKVLIEEDYAMAAEQYGNLRHAPDAFRARYGRNEIGIQAFIEAMSRDKRQQ